MRGGIRMESEAHLELSLASEFVFWSFDDPSCVFLEYDPSHGGVDCFYVVFPSCLAQKHVQPFPSLGPSPAHISFHRLNP